MFFKAGLMKVRFFYIFLSLCVAAVACLFYGFFVEPERLVIREVTVRSDHYQGPPLRIALLSDLHIGGRHMPPSRVVTLVRTANSLSPDLVLLAGDFINGSTLRADRSNDINRSMEHGLSYLKALEAPQGVFAVIGNHDNWYDGAWVTEKLEENAATVLGNEGVNLSGLCLVGMTDFDTADPSADGYKDCLENSSKIVLTHSPDAFRFLRSDTALAVAGHTHGGQINLPLIGRRVTSTRAGKSLAYGLKDVGGVPVFITA